MALVSKVFVLISLFSMAVYSAHVPVPHGSTSSCEAWGVIKAGPYELLSNLWGASGATSGSQCINLTSIKGNTIAWSTTWAWTGGNGVKSFSNVQLDADIGKQLCEIYSMPSTWKWSQSATGAVVSDVAYDLWTSSSPTGDNKNEIMVWLGDISKYHSGPVSLKYNVSGEAVPIVTDIKIANCAWDLYEGNNGYNMVWSFLPTTSTTISHFEGDLNLFLNGSTEATSGSAKFTTSAYSLQIK